MLQDVNRVKELRNVYQSLDIRKRIKNVSTDDENIAKKIEDISKHLCYDRW